MPTENQIDAKESEMSDTLSPSKDKSSDDTSGIILVYSFLFFFLKLSAA